MTYSDNPRGYAYDCEENAERAIEIFAPAGWYYQLGLANNNVVIKAFRKKDDGFDGYWRHAPNSPPDETP